MPQPCHLEATRQPARDANSDIGSECGCSFPENHVGDGTVRWNASEMAEETNKRLSALLAARCPKAVLLAGQPNSLASTLIPDRRGMLLLAAAACYWVVALSRGRPSKVVAMLLFRMVTLEPAKVTAHAQKSQHK